MKIDKRTLGRGGASSRRTAKRDLLGWAPVSKVLRRTQIVGTQPIRIGRVVQIKNASNEQGHRIARVAANTLGGHARLAVGH